MSPLHGGSRGFESLITHQKLKKEPLALYLISGIIVLMSKSDKIIKSVESNFALEGMRFSNREKKIMRDCLSGKTSFDTAVKNAIARYKRA